MTDAANELTSAASEGTGNGPFLLASVVRGTSLAIFEVAFMLGYAETSSFHRAFKRWTNEGPAEFRAKLRGS